MRIYTRGETYWLDVSILGTRYRTTTGQKKKRLAQEWAEKFVAERREIANAKASGKGRELSLGQVWERYQDATERMASASSISVAMRRFLGVGKFADRHHFDPDRTISSITQADIEELIEARRREGLKPNSINGEIAVVSAMLTWAEDRLGITKPRLKLRRLKSEEPRRRLMPEEVRTLLDYLNPEGKDLHPTIAAKRQDIYDMVVLALSLGCRHSELCRLHWTNVDRLNWETVGIWRSKTRKEDRLILPATAVAILKRRNEDGRSSAWVFPSWKNPNNPRRYVNNGFLAALKQLGLNEGTAVTQRGRMTFHGLRRTFASLLADEGVGIYDIQSMLGHATPVMAQHYAKLATNRASARAVEGIERALGWSAT